MATQPKFKDASISIELRVTADGREYRFAVTRFNIDFGTDSIPTGTVSLAMGSELTGLGGDTVNERTQAVLKKGNDVGLYMTVNRGEIQGWTGQLGQPVRIFYGEIISRSPTRGIGSADMTLTIQHWLRWLDSASSLNPYGHPSSPSDMTYPLVVAPSLSSGTTQVSSAIQSIGEPFNNFSVPTIATDLWGQALKPFFLELTQKFPQVGINTITQCVPVPDEPPPRIMYALKNIYGFEGEYGLPYAKGAVPLSLESQDESVIGNLILAIKASIGDTPIQAFAYSTLWGRIANEMRASLHYMVVPTIEHAMVVPHIPCLREAYDVDITDDLQSLEPQISYSKSLSAVGIYANTSFASGSVDPSVQGIRRASACYVSRDVGNTGIQLYVPPPQWLGRLGSEMSSVRKSQQLGNDMQIKAPGITEVATEQATQDGNPASRTVRGVSELLDEYAHEVYVSEKTRSSTLKVAMPLRFDIAPGSTLRVNAPGIDPYESGYVGLVTRCSLFFTAVNGKISGGSVFLLNYVRSSEENKSDDFSQTRHYLYQTKFPGTGLL